MRKAFFLTVLDAAFQLSHAQWDSIKYSLLPKKYALKIVKNRSIKCSLLSQIFVAIILLVSIPAPAQNSGANADSLKRLLTTAKQDTTKVNLLNQLSWAYIFVYADSGVYYAKQGLQLAETIGYAQGKLSNTVPLIIGLTNLVNFGEALYYGFKGIQLAQSLKDTAALSWIYADMIASYRDQEDYKEALAYGYRAKQISGSKHCSPEAKYLALGFIGSVYERTNRLDSALYYVKRAVELNDNNSGILEVFGNIYVKKGNPDSALYYYHKVIPLAQQQRVYIDLVDTYNAMSQVFESKGRKDSSIYYANLSISQEGIHTYPDGALRSALQLAKVYEIKGAEDSVIKYYKLAVSLKDRLFDRQKTREAQRFMFDERLHQQELQQQLAQTKLAFRNRLNIYFLLAGLLILVIVAGGLWRRNVFKQKSYALLQKQKQETDLQKVKVENALSDLKATQAQLIQSEKMASLGELTAGIAHEIQNPLNFVNNFSDVNKELLTELKDEVDKGNLVEVKQIASDVIENEEKISLHGKRADSIVKGMLQHSRASSGKKEATDINVLADEYLRLSYHGMRARDKSFNAEMKTVFDETIGKINVVPQDIGRVLLNLYNNAFYAVSEKKKVANENYHPAVSVVTKRLNSPLGDGGIEIRVSDNGNGIPQNIVDKIFQPFFTTKPTGQGTGLGLSLAYDIIKANGGEIKVETKEGEGSEFRIELPFNAAQ
jgi:signal transduction histidine kinase